MRRVCAPILGAALMILLTACGLSIPVDPDGTLDRVSGGTLRVGISPNGELTVVDDDGMSGREVELVEGFAASIDAEIEWTESSEATLVRGLEDGTLDLAIAGFTDQSPWSDRAAMTRPHTQTTADDGSVHNIVMLVPMGENAFLSDLERYLDDHAGYQASGAVDAPLAVAETEERTG